MLRLPMLLLAFFLAGMAAAQSKIYYVSPQGGGDGSSWQSTMKLSEALTAASAGDQIWVQGFVTVDGTDKLYEGSFTVKSGVQLYGGFAGTETKLTDRVTLGKPYQLKYRSVLSGDKDNNDVVDDVNLIFPANGTRSDNEAHVLTLNMDPQSSGNNNTYPTVVNGFTITGGQAAGEGGKGGGVYVTGDNAGGGNFRIERCFLFNNYATQGGAVYVDAAVQNRNNGKSLINQCVIYNNAAGERAAVENQGGGVYLAGEATVVNTSIFNNENGGMYLQGSDAAAVNATVARNTGAGVDAASTSQKVTNSIIWGNSVLSLQQQPTLSHSAFHEVTVTNTDAGTDGNGNVYVAKENRDAKAGPYFDAPSLRTGYDRDFSWRDMSYPTWSWNVLEGSVMIDKGDNAAYQTDVYGNEDMAGNNRISGTAISIGAYEYQYLPASRIRYVKPTATGTGDGSSWDNASGDLQKMIDELAESAPSQTGEVWVAAGTYTPQVQLISGTDYSASFRMRDGISVYGGFEGTETSKLERAKGAMPWNFTNETVLCGAAYANNLSWNSNRWTLTSDSRHVVWFAPMPDEGATSFTHVTTLDGVTIKGGYAQGGTGLTEFMTDRGAGVYMSQNAYLQHCIVTENTATGNGGGVYEHGGRVLYSLLYNNNSDADGGAVYMDNAGIVLASMLTNNSASNGAGAYLSHNAPWAADGQDHPEYLIVSTSVVSNNTSRNNGAIYCDKGGVLLQNTITNNYCPTATDNTASNASQTGGLYIDSYALVVNSVLWNNTIQDRNVPMYAKNPTAQTVRFMYTALSGMNNSIWNNTLQQEMIQLSDGNDMTAENTVSPDFTAGYPTTTGVDGSLRQVSYFWKPVPGSNLRAQGMTLGTFPSEVLLAPEIDIAGSLFAQKPAVGAYNVETVDINPADDGSSLKVYVNVDCTVHDHDGSSWDKGYRSLNEAIAYLAGLSKDVVGNHTLEVHVQEGDIWPRYAFTNLDPQTATIDIPATASGQPIYIYGGYAAGTHERTPLTTRSIINGNHEGKDQTAGLYHCITVAQGAKAIIDGFHIINGYAAGEASRQYGAGLLVHTGADVTVRNCIFENNTAQEGAAVDARGATLKMENCVVNNNTNTDENAAVVNGNGSNLTLNFTTLVQNKGKAYSDGATLKSSYATANTSGNTHTIDINTTNYTNPTKAVGATLGFDTYLGGYSSFQPTNQNPVVNQGTADGGVSTDITLGSRSLGGAPDLGAYEASLPADGTVIYVRQGATGDGSSWTNALGSISAALGKAQSGQEIWVAAGTYNERVTMKDGVNVLGGFAASGNPTNKLDDTNRDISNAKEGFMTTIDGQAGGRVVTQDADFNTLTTWEGLIIQNGSTSGDNTSINGAGAYIRKNGKLKNCKIQNNKIEDTARDSRAGDAGARTRGGAGVYVNGGIVESCIITQNSLSKQQHNSVFGITVTELEYTCGAGIYLNGGTLINSLIVKNTATTHNSNYNAVLGVAAYISNTGNFYNCTFADNTGEVRTQAVLSSGGIVPGVWDDSGNSEFKNCIFWGNVGTGGREKENLNQIGFANEQSGKNLTNCYAAIASSDMTNSWDDLDATYQVNTTDPTEFKNRCDANKPYDDNYQLIANATGLHCINKGDNTSVENNNIDLDAAGATRIQNCTVDKGAYESTDAIPLQPDANGVYYVTENGAGTANGSSVGNAACAMELQRVLNVAGERVKSGQTATVKIAGYEGASFTYHANTLSDPNDPQSYTYVIPYGVTVMGGYDGMADDWTKAESYNPMKYKTVLSALTDNSALEQQVNGYHAISFGTKPEGWTGADAKTIVDGLCLTDGKATSLSNLPEKTHGGGAIVPAWAHVRNCIVSNCQAEKGGGLYLLPGATVSGTAIIGNTAEDGGGLYADATEVTQANRAHMVSCTITDNTATSEGGGVYMEDEALMAMNAVVWGNTAPSDKNISGVVSSTFADDVWSSALESSITAYYPFNHSFVETYDLPSNFENTSMTSGNSEGDNSYFANDERILKTYSPLIKHGMDTKYQTSLATALGLSATDMQGIQRNQDGVQRVDAGAYAFDGGVMPTDKLVTRIFVSQGANVQLRDGAKMDDYIGRSFYTSLTWLDDALEYIKAVRSNGVATADTKFEILVAGGTYTPSYQRSGAASNTVDQRQNSYVIPQGVSIYGGFSGTELYSSKANDQSDITSIPNVSGTLTCNGDIAGILAARETSDFNQNSIIEPWELANQTILSGHVNVSANVKNAYHVLFSTADGSGTVNPVVLDGITVMDGETSNTLSNVQNGDELGRGGGVYSSGVSYLANRCRFVNNFAVRGGAIYVRDAKLTLINSLLAGNGTVDNPTTEGGDYQPPRGGAVYVAGVSSSPSISAGLYAVNTLWVNNETSGQGGAIGTNYADGLVATYAPEVSLMNNTFALNKAQNNAVIYHNNGKNVITNTLMWGNVATNGNISQTDESNTTITHSASDVTDLSGTGNIKLSSVNTDVNGPRFTRPATVAGVAGNDANHLWNPSSISVLTDAGDGTEPANGGTITGAYDGWWGTNSLTDYKSQYMGDVSYLRYAGPRNDDGTQADKPIDIGVYEYQYNTKFPEMDAIYVATTESGLADGSSWANATSDLRGALVAMANPTGGTSKDKAVYIKAGNYSSSLLSTGTSFPVHLGTTDFGTSLTIKGSYNESGVQDFSQPTVITTQDGQASLLMEVTTQADKTVGMEGLSFINTNANGNGLKVSSQGGAMTLKQLAFRQNAGTGLQVASGNAGKLLLANVLFADGGTGLAADGNTTVVNATFAQNKTADLTGAPAVYNSVAWNNGTQYLQTDGTHNNVAIDGTEANDDVQKGPNFRDPENGDYRIRPSVLLLDKGSQDNYKTQVGISSFDNEKDLANNARLTGDQIDVGAYEYEATLKPIVYVKADLTGTADGNSWTTALGDLQGAIDLAGIYANGHPDEQAYVFVHNNYHAASNDQLSLSMPNVKVYGGMNDETSSQQGVSAIVSDLLGKRKGMLEATSRSSLQNVTLGADAVVDGFVVNGTAAVNNGVLSTSVVNGSVTGQADGVLYNSLALGSVTGVKAVNVTATSDLNNVAEGSGNNRASASENTYVTTDYWKYQLMETDADNLDKGTDATTQTYIDKVGHSRDLIGNKRIRNTVDNGCFETWNITTDGAQIMATDKPIGQSVVYVRQGKELSMAEGVYPEGQNFTPGYLLLEHQAGLRGNGNYISLNNFAVEREVKASGNDLAVMPFDVTGVTPDAGYSLNRYNGSTRAAYDYTFDNDNADNSKAWEALTQSSQLSAATEGFLIKNKSDANPLTVRFSGTSYTEGGEDKSVVLMKYNFNEPWTSTSTGSNNRFTHKENMSWNLFGSPYLCAMNYGDMEYGRVLYGYVNVNGTYQTVNTANETEGYIPAGDAVFTQTATLKDYETFTVATSASRQGDAYASAARLQLTLSPAEATRATADGAPASDMLQLNAVPADEARQDFDLGADGVKWMSTAAVPQLYAVRSGNRYSLLSAVSEEGETALGVTAPKAGVYQLGIVNNEGYETVELTDHETGRTVDLTTSAYTFTLPADTCLDHRFTLRFRTLSDEGATGGIRIELQADGSICVSGLEAGQHVQAYSVGGQLEWKHVATESQCVFRLQRGVHLIEVSEGGTKRAVSKLMVP